MGYFILALIGKAGLNSLYAFQKRAELQPGGIRPILRELERLGLIFRAESSKRGRRDFSVTDRGIAFLNETWSECLRDYLDAEAVLRATCVALLMGDPGRAGQYLQEQSRIRHAAVQEKTMKAEGRLLAKSDPLSIYGWFRAVTAHVDEKENVLHSPN